MKQFNTTAVCIPSKHYMVDLTDRLAAIQEMIDAGKYFTINRARQYGKTTTLAALKKAIEHEYIVLFLDFQGIGNSGFSSEETFVQELSRLILKRIKIDSLSVKDQIRNELTEWRDTKAPVTRLGELFDVLMEWCEDADREIVLMIDEVDSATNNQVFLDFLAQLRDTYINRDIKDIRTFKSVILAGVTDIKHLKAKIRDDSDSKENSPWNTREGNEPSESLLSFGDCPRDQMATPFDIAADFMVDMSLSQTGIQGMLDEYEADHHSGMDTASIAKQIREYTNGYPYLVSRICQIIDERMVPGQFHDLRDAWTEYGVDEAVKIMLSETGNSLFDSLTGKLTNYPNLKKKLKKVLLRGETLAWLPYDEEQQQLYMYGFIRNDHNTVAVSNRVFEMLLYTHFIGENNDNDDLKQIASETKSVFVDEDGVLDIPKIMDHFIIEHNRIHGDNTEKFLEDEGRERFVTYVAAIINGTGTYSIEEQTRNHKRMDMVIHYLGKRYVIEIKIWRGDRYNADGEKQITEYLDYFGLSTGYMLSFNFNQKKKSGVELVHVGDKTIYEGTV